LAARRADDEALLQRLSRLAHVSNDFDGRAGYERFIEHDTEFHIAIAELTRNPLLVQTVSDMRSQMERVMYAAIDIGYFGEAPVREHNEILKAIRQRDGDRARQLMYQHIIGSLSKALGLAT
jgi:DNA-binding FadR family transcriptional regulator